MKLISLMLENFQGIKTMAFCPGGNSASIYGDNATGKTTVFNAMTWLLFDKASTGAKNFTPKTKGPDGDLHYLNHAVEGQFSVDGGRLVTLKKVYHETYKKKRGSNSEEFDGHTVEFYLDGVPVKEKEYNEAVQEFCGDPERMKMLSMPDYFPEAMAWEDRREILLDICGDVEDAEVIAGTKELSELKAYLLMPGTKDQYYTVDEFQNIARVKKNDINRDLEQIPGRIDEAQRAIPDLTGISLVSIDAKVKDLSRQKEEIEKEKAQLTNKSDLSAKIRQQIAEANTQLAEARAKHAKDTNKANEAAYTAIEELKGKQVQERNDYRDIKGEIDNLSRITKRLTDTRKELIEEYKKIQAEAWDPALETCPTCGQSMPADQVERMRGEFLLHKSQRLEKNVARGKAEASKELIDENYSNITALEKDLAAREKTINDYIAQLETLQGTLKNPEPFELTMDYAEIKGEIDGLRAKEQNNEQRFEKVTAGLREKIQAIDEQMQEQEELRATLRTAETQQKRIKELGAREKELSAAYEGIEKGIYLCELFIKTKVGMLTERINGKFKCVRFRLFVEQLNGGVKEDCEVMIPSEGGRMVPYAFANNAARINAGLEIIDTLSRHWGMEIPIFIDNAESVTHLLSMDAQLIRLIVSEKDKVLRTEIDGREAVAAGSTAVKSKGRGRNNGSK